jgi:hypothetical protein
VGKKNFFQKQNGIKANLEFCQPNLWGNLTRFLINLLATHSPTFPLTVPTYLPLFYFIFEGTFGFSITSCWLVMYLKSFFILSVQYVQYSTLQTPPGTPHFINPKDLNQKLFTKTRRCLINWNVVTPRCIHHQGFETPQCSFKSSGELASSPGNHERKIRKNSLMYSCQHHSHVENQRVIFISFFSGEIALKVQSDEN